MKASLIASTLALASTINADSVVFSVRKADGSPQGYLTTVLTGVQDKSFFGVSPKSQHFTLENGVISAERNGKVSKMGLEGTLLALGPDVKPLNATFRGSTLASNNFWLCTGSTVAHVLHKERVVYTSNRGDDNKPFELCEKIHLDKYNVGSHSTTTRETVVDTDCSTSTPVSWSNGTVTAPVTYTSYTTYCPEPTVITITSCDVHLCGPKTLTVTSASTVTCALCLVPATTQGTQSKASVTEQPRPTQGTAAKPGPSGQSQGTPVKSGPNGQSQGTATASQSTFVQLTRSPTATPSGSKPVPKVSSTANEGTTISLGLVGLIGVVAMLL